MYLDPSGNMPQWLKWTIGFGIILGLGIAALTIGGAVIIGASIGAKIGGISKIGTFAQRSIMAGIDGSLSLGAYLGQAGLHGEKNLFRRRSNIHWFWII